MEGLRIEVSGLEKGARLTSVNGRVLACLYERQDINLKVVSGEGGPQLIRDAIDMIRWNSVNSSMGIARQALVTAGIFRSEDMELRSMLICQQGRWNPAVELVGSPDMREISFDRVSAVIGLAFSELMAPSSSLNFRFSPVLQEIEAEAVRSTVQVSLETAGGRVFPNELHVEVNGDLLVKLNGRTKPKPDRSVFAPVPVELEGVLHGFHRGQEMIFFGPVNGSAIAVGFGRLDIDLEWIAKLAIERNPVRLRLHQTRSKRGASVYSFVRCTKTEGYS